MYVNTEIADNYQEFFNFMNQEHGLILTIEQMDEIVSEAQKLVKKLTIPNVVGQSEQLANFCKKISQQEDCPAEFQEIVNKEFWDLIS